MAYNVIFLSYHCCIRVLKEADALLKRGVNIYFLQNTVTNQEFLEAMPYQIGFFSSPESLKIKLQNFENTPITAIHVHNHPDWLVRVAKEALPHIPIIYDCHDLDSIRFGKPTEDEVVAMNYADAYIFPSVSYMKRAITQHSLKPNRPKDVIYSMCFKDFFVYDPLPRQRGIVYEGAILHSINRNIDTSTNFPKYRDYLSLAHKLKKMDIPFSVYGISEDFISEYIKAGVNCFRPINYFYLIQHLSRYDWGFVGCPEKHPQWDMAIPNKLFDYLTAGIPILVYNAAECAEFVEKNSLGIALDKIEKLSDIYNEHEKYRKKVVEKRHLFTMDSQAEKLLAIYKLFEKPL